MNNNEYIINEIRLELGDDEKKAKTVAAKMVGIKETDFSSFFVSKKAIDARKKFDIHFKYNAIFSVNEGVSFSDHFVIKREKPLDLVISKVSSTQRPIIVGSGPSGLFAALVLSRAGLKPIILEQGKPAKNRKEDVDAFWAGKKLEIASNVQFGQGGAGTFSDGKLNSGTRSEYSAFVLSEFVKNGAPIEIEYAHAPHVGTDILIDVVISLQKEIEANGGEFLFQHTFSGFEIKDSCLCEVSALSNGKTVFFKTNKLILGIGHSSRKTFELLYDKKISLEQKPFSVGLRIEHLQSEISKSQYGENAHLLPPADYKLFCHLPSGRSVYTFCNCPGGYVVNASSEENGVVCNGMSYSARDGQNANSALLVNVEKSDYGSDHPLAGIRFQEKWEQKAFSLSNSHKLPVQKLCDFLRGKPTLKFGTILPQTKGQVVFADLNDCLPKYVTDSIKEALPIFENKIHGFTNPDAVLTGVETRSSCPIKIVRDDTHQTSTYGIYACGEGSGYAGGIMSSCVDGIKTALNILKSIQQ